MIIVFDIDNTLYDFVKYYARFFRATVHVIAQQTGLNEEEIKTELKDVFQKHGTLEYQFLMQESSIFSNMSEEKYKKIEHIIFVASRRVRAKSLNLYEGVIDTLNKLSEANITCVALTNAPFYQIDIRFKQLKLHKYFDSLFCAEGAPPGTTVGELKYEKVKYWLDRKYRAFETLPNHDLKPSQRGFELIKGVYGNDDYIVIGDSISKDLNPAKALGFTTIWAEYGSQLDEEDLSTLIEITPWSKKDVDEVKGISRHKGYIPDFTISNLHEIIDILDIPYQRNLFD